MPRRSAAVEPSQTVRKAPDAAPATDGSSWRQLVHEVARNGAPCGVGPAQTGAARQNAASAPPMKTTAFTIEAPFLIRNLYYVILYYGRADPSVGGGSFSGLRPSP